MRNLSAFLCMALVLAGCGSKQAETSVPAETPEETADPGVIYDDNDLMIRFIDIDDDPFYPEIKLEISNQKEEEIGVKIDALVLNDEWAMNSYFHETIPAKETIETTDIIDMEIFHNKGLNQISKLQGYLTITDAEYNTLLEKKCITIYEDPSVSVSSYNSSGTVIYDQDGVSVSYEGFPEVINDAKQFIFLVSNNSSAFIDITFNSDIFKIDGEYASDKTINGSYVTIPAGKKALISAEIVDSETYEPSAFESADLWLNIYDEDYSSVYIPIHMIAEDDTVSAGEPYTQGKLSNKTYRIHSGDNYEEYITFYYDALYNRLEGIVDETKYYKSAGFTPEYFENEEVQDIISVYDNLDFEETIMDETETTIDMIIVFRNLSDPDNLIQMHEIGYFTLADPDHPSALNAEALFQLYDDSGAESIDPSQYEEYNLHADVY